MKKKLYLFCFIHALPTCIGMDEDGVVVDTHAGTSADDATSWFLEKGKHQPDKYEIEIVDQQLVERHIYNDEPIEILPVGLVEAFRKNQELKKKLKLINIFRYS